MSGSLQPLVGYGAVAYKIANSLRFRSSASAYLSRTPGSAGNQRTFTFSTWLKRGALGNYIDFFGAGNTYLSYYNDNTLYMNLRGGATNYVVNYANVFRDPSAWYHIVWAVDTTQATASNRAKVYVNGVQLTAAGPLGQSYCPQNDVLNINSTSAHYLGAAAGASNFFDGYLADINFIDGQALDPTSFGAFDATTGVWTPKSYAGTYGTNGFHLNFSNGTSTTTLGYDSSGNGNNWTTNNISLTAGSTYDWMLDSPTPYQGSSYGVGNYAVWNPAFNHAGWSTSTANIQQANLLNYRALHSVAVATMPIKGKTYWEITVSDSNQAVGIINQNDSYSGTYSYDAPSAKGVYCWSVQGYINGSGVVVSGGPIAGFTGSAIFMFAVDPVAGYMWVGKDGVWNGNPTAGTGAFWTNLLSTIEYTPWVHPANSAQANDAYANFGQRPFAYTPPSGYKSLCTYNLPTPTIQNGAGYMAATLYTGTLLSNAVSNAVNGVSFQPDLVWVKSRSAATDHKLTDSVRGTTKALVSDSTAAETTDSQGLTAFGSSGFTVGTDTTYNNLAATYVGWQWKAGGTAVTNTAGSITSSVSANTTSGFSVVTYTGNGVNGATVGHGLGVTPNFVIMKGRSTGAYNWNVYHSAVPNGYLQLNTTDGLTTTAGRYITPGSSVLTLTSYVQFNENGTTQVAYCFAAIPGYSAFGSYTGNGSSDGPFVFLGFRPRFVLFKRTDLGEGWFILDTSRNTYNVSGLDLQPQSANAETNDSPVLDFLANGVKLRNTYTAFNASGSTYIYAAFAENPFNYSLAR